MGVKRLAKSSYGYKCLEIDPEGGQGPAWTLEPVEEREREYTC